MAGFLTFAAVFALDLIWARYTIAVANHRPVTAGIHASAITLLSGFAAINYVNDYHMLLPAVVGAFCGTIFGMISHRGPA